MIIGNFDVAITYNKYPIREINFKNTRIYYGNMISFNFHFTFTTGSLTPPPPSILVKILCRQWDIHFMATVQSSVKLHFKFIEISSTRCRWINMRIWYACGECGFVEG